jgi:hypothetical protein
MQKRREEHLKKQFIILFLVLFLFGGDAVGIYKENNLSFDQSRQKRLEDILFKAGEYCNKLKQVSLHSVCQEEVKERVFHPYRIKKVYGLEYSSYKTEENIYLYDYQLIRKDFKALHEDIIEEIRILLKENGNTVDLTLGFWSKLSL